MRRDELKQKRIGMLLGGLSPERDVSLESGKNCGDALRERGYQVIDIDVGREVSTHLVNQRIEIAFLALHGRYGEDGCMQGLLEVLQIPYTGSSVLASAAAMDKLFSKRLFATLGVNTPEHVTVEKQQLHTAQPPPFGFPCVVKPAAQGSSVGIAIVKDEAHYFSALVEAAKFGKQILIEPLIQGREIQVAVLHDEVLGSVEIQPTAEFYDYHAKYIASDTRYVTPAPVTAAQEQELFAVTLKAHRALGCSGVTRSDLILDDKGRAWMLEVNTLPGMTAHSLVPMIAQMRGLSFADVTEKILEGAALHA